MWKTAKRATIAGVLSLIAPGLGQLYNGQVLKGWLLFTISPTSLFLAYTLKLSHSFCGLFGYLVVALCFLLVCLVEAVWTSVHQSRAGVNPVRKWPVYATGAVMILWLVVVSRTDIVLDRILGVRAYKIPVTSMEPTIEKGDRIVADMQAFRNQTPQRGDIIIFVLPQAGVLYFKRVIAVGGDTIQGDLSEVKVNGEVLHEKYLNSAKHDENVVFDPRGVYGPLKVPPNQLFVLGDNRFRSYDSRHFGTIPLEKVRGRPLFIYWSSDPHRIGKRVD
jgi:signal peptidase I